LGDRECSIQRKNQKLIEEAPANGLSIEKRRAIYSEISHALTKLGYSNAGTCEFLLDNEGRFYFMEMNARLQVEHPVTELTTGLDLVEWQLRIAANEAINFSQEDIKSVGHAIECRINAEDPANGFLPSPGLIEKLVWPKASPQGPLRIDTHIEQGYRVVPFYDSMVAKIIAFGQKREDALKLMKQALSTLEIEGIHTTAGFQQRIIENSNFAKGSYDCSFIEKNLTSLLKAQVT
jgi:acetyl-CoA carboxylase biotin carboxylase subunit